MNIQGLKLDLNQIISKNIKKIPYVMATVPITAVFASKALSDDKVELSEKAKFVKTLEKNNPATNITVKFQGDAGKVVLRSYLGSRSGSNPAFWALDTTTNKLYYIKHANTENDNGHIKSEIEASKLYNLAGIKTPEIKECLIDGKYLALASEYVSGMQEISDTRIAHSAFAVDAWLANWDSLIDDNTMVVDGELVKIDNGGALDYRAQGLLKESFGALVNELITLVDGKNYYSKRIYSSISHQALIDSFTRVCSITDAEICEVVKDAKKLSILIARRNYMSKVLENIKKTPYNGRNIAEYMKTVTKLTENNVFEAISTADEFAQLYKKEINPTTQTVPSTKKLYKMLLDFIKKKEKQGVQISREQLIDLIQIQINNELPLTGLNRFQTASHKENNQRIFTNLHRFAIRTPMKEGEKISSYMNRLINLNKKRQKQLDDFRIKNIKDNLHYVESTESVLHVISPEIKQKIIKELNSEIKENWDNLKLLSANASTQRIVDTWRSMCIGSNDDLPPSLSEELLSQLERYNSSHKPKLEEVKIDPLFCDSSFIQTDYKVDFKYEPVYRWLSIASPTDFVQSLPRNGGIISFDKIISCSMNKFYAEEDYNDQNPKMNVKFVIHPKSETSNARNLGYNQEVLYGKDQSFRIIDKELVEYVDETTGQSLFKWEIHLQEV